MHTVSFNGKTYNDVTEMPAKEREAYEKLMSMFKDENQDGIPDIFQGDAVSNIMKTATNTIILDGKQVSQLRELSPERRKKYEESISMFERLGIISRTPDLESISQASHPRATPIWDDTEIRASMPLFRQPSAIQEDKGVSRWLSIALALLGILICGVGAITYFLLG